jgi:diguanylate cyclase (GGDEF)-like protein
MGQGRANRRVATVLCTMALALVPAAPALADDDGRDRGDRRGSGHAQRESHRDGRHHGGEHRRGNGHGRGAGGRGEGRRGGNRRGEDRDRGDREGGGDRGGGDGSARPATPATPPSAPVAPPSAAAPSSSPAAERSPSRRRRAAARRRADRLAPVSPRREVGGAFRRLGTSGGAALSSAPGAAASAPGRPARRRAPSPAVTYAGEERASPVGLAAPLTSAITSIPDLMWVAIAALLALSALLAATTVAAAVRTWRRDQTIRNMEQLAFTDSLTGVLNRGALEQALHRELARAQRYGRPMALLLFDVDNLKAVNDRHGHGAGDELLRAVGLTLTDTVRDHDICGRLGGDEYVVAVLEEGRLGAERVLERIQAQIPARRADLGLATSWGVSAGAAAYPEDGETVRDLMAAADRRLYASRGIDID